MCRKISIGEVAIEMDLDWSALEEIHDELEGLDNIYNIFPQEPQ